MSIVTVHGPNTMYVGGAGGAGTANTVTNTGGTVTADVSSTRKFTFAGAGDRATADYDWTFTGETAQANTKTGTVTFSSGGAKTITLTLGTTGGTTPAGGTYTFNVNAGGTTAAPRSLKQEDGEPQVHSAKVEEEDTSEVDVGYDPAAHTVAEVEEFAVQHPEQARDLYDAEVAGKNRTTLVAHLESLIPFDPADYAVADVISYAEENPDEVEDILDAERDGKNRSTLVSFLEARLDAE